MSPFAKARKFFSNEPAPPETVELQIGLKNYDPQRDKVIYWSFGNTIIGDCRLLTHVSVAFLRNRQAA